MGLGDPFVCALLKWHCRGDGDKEADEAKSLNNTHLEDWWISDESRRILLFNDVVPQREWARRRIIYPSTCVVALDECNELLSDRSCTPEDELMILDRLAIRRRLKKSVVRGKGRELRSGP